MPQHRHMHRWSQMGSHADRHTDGQMCRNTDRHTYGQTCRNVDRHTDGQRYRTMHRGTYRKMHYWRERWTETEADTVSTACQSKHFGAFQISLVLTNG